MAEVAITRDADGSLTVSISVDDSFPDVVAEATVNAARAFVQALEASLAADALEDDGE